MSDDTVHLTVPADADGERLDRFLTRMEASRTRSALRKMIDEGLVAVDGVPARKAGMSLSPGMMIEVTLPEPPSEIARPEKIPIDVVYEDDHLVVVCKSAGLVVHPGHGNLTGTLVNALLGRGTTLSSIGAPERPGIVHRLDRETSGLMVVAKTDQAHRSLAASFAGREVEKIYRALVWGHPKPDEGVIEKSIGRSRKDRTVMSVHAVRGRHAVTRFKTVEIIPGFSMLRITLLTGRTHQIRVHLQSINHPVVGDNRYGGRQWKSVQDPIKRGALRGFTGQALHAAKLGFTHPATGRKLRFKAKLPAEFQELLDALKGVS